MQTLQITTAPEFEDAQPSKIENRIAESTRSKMHIDGPDDEYINLGFEILEQFEQGSNTKPYNLRRCEKLSRKVRR